MTIGVIAIVILVVLFSALLFYGVSALSED
jgi:hypothetical protein